MAIRIHRASRNASFDWEHLCQTYEKHVRLTDTVIEIGASVPERTTWLASMCNSLVGVELFPERVPKTSGNIRYVIGDWQNLASILARDSIDVAVSSHVIEHVPDDLKALNELYDVLRPGGVAIINTPNRKRLVRTVIEVVGKEREFPWWEHVREYTEADLTALLQRSKFQKWSIEGIVFGLHGGPVFCYLTHIPASLKAYANYWEVVLYKTSSNSGSEGEAT